MVRFYGVLVLFFLVFIGYINRQPSKITKAVDSFNGELKIKKHCKSYPSEPFSKWKGDYFVILIDLIDNEEFHYRYNAADSFEKIFEGISSKRFKKNVVVKQQLQEVSFIKKNFKEQFLLKCSDDTTTEIRFYILKSVFEESKYFELQELLVKISNKLPSKYDVSISIIDDNKKIKKNACSIEENIEQCSDLFLRTIKFNSPMYALSSGLKDIFFRRTDYLSDSNFFYSRTGSFFYTEYHCHGDFFNKIFNELNKNLDPIFCYLEVRDGKVVLIGIATDRGVSPDKGYKIQFCFQSMHWKISELN